MRRPYWIIIILIIFAAFVSYLFAYEKSLVFVQKQESSQEPKELLPDLVPLPAQDLTLRKENGKLLLLFSTTYFNQGTGPLELRGDATTSAIRADIERDVFQRIYFTDNTFTDALVGEFLWHQEHFHHHFTDFLEYDLESVDTTNHPDLSGSRIKATFCVRDVSKVNLNLVNRKSEAIYLKCDKDFQGVSVGWGDTYYYDYPAQNIEITDLASGTYRFTQIVNPAFRITESNYANNKSTVTFMLDMENQTIKVLEEIPSNVPDVEHVHLEQPFGVSPR